VCVWGVLYWAPVIKTIPAAPLLERTQEAKQC
jgi:hypothetical protein